MPLPPCSRRQPARTGGGKEASRTGGGGGVCVYETVRKKGGSRGPLRFLPASCSVTFYNHGNWQEPPHRSTPSPVLASPLALRPRLGLACLPACLPLAASPFFCPLFNLSLLVFGLLPAGRQSARLSPSLSPLSIGKLASGAIAGVEELASMPPAGLRSRPNALLMTIWSEMMGHLSLGGLFRHDRDASVR